MAAAAILNFGKSVILCINYRHSYGERRSAHKIWWKLVQKWLKYTCLYIFKMAAVGHLGIIFPHFGLPTMSLLVGYIFPASGVVI